MPSNNPLPPKENALFKRILKYYEHKQYKNGLKFAKQILSNPKFQDHGETLAMKGLILNGLGRKEEAYQYVRRGLRNDLKSYVCWHVFGLLQRSDKKYDEAIKCYRNALKLEKDNIQILRDLSLLQIQMRDLEGYRDTRYQLLMLRPIHRASWIGYAMSFHLLGDYKNALSILETFIEQQQKTSNFDYEHSELLLYQNMVIQESGDLKGALKHLIDNQDQIIDKLTLKENLGDLHLQLEEYDKAVMYFEELIQRNPENTKYYKKLIEAKQLTQSEDIVEFYERFAEKYPRSMPPKRLPLNYASGDLFKNLVDKYMRRALSKGVPPLFVDLRGLYSDKSKVEIIENLLFNYVECLKKCGKYSEGEVNNGPKEPASALLWVYYYLAQHYDYLKQTEKALSYIDMAIEHTPTLIELFIVKGRIYKHAGDPASAHRWLDEAQSLDTADRYVNSKAARYALRAGRVADAEAALGRFTRDGAAPADALDEMQCMWFQTECAAAHQRARRWGEALKKCHEVDRHFSEIIDDQFDFHTYCVRKVTLRSYVGLLRLEDVLRGHPFYFRAARTAIQVYLRLFDEPLADDVDQQELDTENLAPSELKKLRNKQRKARRKAERESAQAREAQSKREQHHRRAAGGAAQGGGGGGTAQAQPAADAQEGDAPRLDDLVPDKLARVEDPLEQAIKFLQPLQTLAKDKIETHLMAFEVYYRKKKVLLMLQSLKRAHKVDSSHPKLHSCMIRFRKIMQTDLDLWDPSVREVVEKETGPYFNGKDPKQLNKEFLESNSNSLMAAYEGAKIMYQLDDRCQAQALKLVTGFDNKYTDVNIEICTEILDSLRNGDFGSCNEQVEEFVSLCHSRFPYAAAFKPPESTTETNHIGGSDQPENCHSN